ncbi:MAG: aminopeptidase P family protein [Oligoflexia bacterium]|nr:aminopeptidase P family protein [Oligoflexia bacterium]
MEKRGDHFKLSELLQARELALTCLGQIRNKIQAGMTEAEGHEIIKEVCLENGAEKFWHPSKFRIDFDTNKSFREPSENQTPLTLGQLYFVDFGPVFQGYEADLGDTFKLGEPSFINPAKEVFDELKSLWKEDKISGEKLYLKARELAQSKGLSLNEKMVGHRLSDFPHAIYYRGSLESCEKTPIEGAWVLEIHLIDQKNKCGYFYEDLLF